MIYKLIYDVFKLLFMATAIVIIGAFSLVMLIGIIFINLKFWAIAIEEGSMMLGFAAAIFSVFTMICFTAISND